MNPKKVNIVLSRRDRIEKASSTVFIAVAIASAVVIFSLVSLRFLWQQKSYNDRIVKAKTTARNQLRTNLSNLSTLTNQFTALNSNPATNSTTILHALPPTYDYSALASSMQFLAQQSGVTFVGSIGEDDSANSITSSVTSTPQEIPMTIQVNGPYANIVTFIGNLEKSIRPINVNSASYTGVSSNVQATLQATTYYQPPRSLDVTRSQIK